MRTVPVNKSIPVEHAVGTYDRIRDFVEASAGPFGIIPCICRQGRALTGEPCKQTSEPRNCLMLGIAARMMIDKGVAQAVTKEEMLGFLEKADRDGLVLEPQNTQNPMFVCCCCGCCCGVLGTAKKLPKPAEFFQSDFVAALEPEKCQVCGTCVTRCQMDAIAEADGPPEIARRQLHRLRAVRDHVPLGGHHASQEGTPPPAAQGHEGHVPRAGSKRGTGPFRTATAIAGHMLGRKF